MKKTQSKKLTLAKETLRIVKVSALNLVRGASGMDGTQTCAGRAHCNTTGDCSW